MLYKLLVLPALVLMMNSCNPDDIISEFSDSTITAKSKLGEVLNAAKNNFAMDAKLSLIYGLNVSTKGEVDLLKPTENAFVYVVQSDSEAVNEFYIPVYNSTPVRSPLSFNGILSFVKNQQAKDILDLAFSKLSEINIASSVSYDDSPQIISKMLTRTDVIAFRSANLNSKIDMFLIPSKSLDTLNVRNDADWVLNFYDEFSSLVLWLHPGTVNGNVEILSN